MAIHIGNIGTSVLEMAKIRHPNHALCLHYMLIIYSLCHIWQNNLSFAAETSPLIYDIQTRAKQRHTIHKSAHIEPTHVQCQTPR